MRDRPFRQESLIDMQIRLAQERGEFDDLPGAGKPLPGRGVPDDELWWIKGLVQRERITAEGLLPTGLQLAREVERLPEKVSGLASDQSVRRTVAELNTRIRDYLRLPSGPYVPLAPVDEDDVVRRWRAERARRSAAGPAPSPRDADAPAAPRRRWWSPWRRRAGAGGRGAADPPVG